jgi:probable HAF family extracellular repeat protein
MMQMVHSRFNALLSACVLSLIATASWSQSLTWLGTLPGGGDSYAYGVSDNGVVVGYAINAAGQRRAFRWTASDGMQDLGTLGGNQSYAYGVSANGAVVVGWAENAAGQSRAFRWQNGVMQDLGTLGGCCSEAYGVSANGAVVVGWADAAGQWRAFRWQNGVMQDLGTLPGGDWSEAWGVSADGSVVVGSAYNAARYQRAVRWTASGIEDLNITYGDLLTPNSVLREARAISPDGRYIVGYGYNAATGRWEAFLLDTGTGRSPCTLNGDVNGDGVVDDADLLEVLFNFGNRCP